MSRKSPFQSREGRHYRFTVLLVAALVLLRAATAEAGSVQWVMEGTLGKDSVGMTLNLDPATANGKNDAAKLDGHYFYARDLKDIPLTGTEQNGELLLQEAGGASFHLHFRGNGSEGSAPLSFHNSVGLDGIRTGATGTLPVRLSFTTVTEATIAGHRYQLVTTEEDAVFEAKVQGFRRAVLEEDRSATAAFVAFPLRVNQAGKSRVVRSSAELLSRWSDVFTPAYRAALAKAIPHDMFIRNGQVMIGEGLTWFTGKGATTINVP